MTFNNFIWQVRAAPPRRSLPPFSVVLIAHALSGIPLTCGVSSGVLVTDAEPSQHPRESDAHVPCPLRRVPDDHGAHPPLHVRRRDQGHERMVGRDTRRNQSRRVLEPYHRVAEGALERPFPSSEL